MLRELFLNMGGGGSGIPKLFVKFGWPFFVPKISRDAIETCKNVYKGEVIYDHFFGLS